MQQVLGLKAPGTVLVRFTNSPITRSKEAIVGTYHEFGLICGGAMPKSYTVPGPISGEPLSSTIWTKAELEILVAKSMVQYRAAATSAVRAHNRWRSCAGTVDDAEKAVRLDDYHVARAICDAQRLVLNHLIDQLGFVPKVSTSASRLSSQ